MTLLALREYTKNENSKIYTKEWKTLQGVTSVQRKWSVWGNRSRMRVSWRHSRKVLQMTKFHKLSFLVGIMGTDKCLEWSQYRVGQTGMRKRKRYPMFIWISIHLLARPKARSTGRYLWPELLDGYKKLQTEEEYFSLSLIIPCLMGIVRHISNMELETSRILRRMSHLLFFKFLPLLIRVSYFCPCHFFWQREV